MYVNIGNDEPSLSGVMRNGTFTPFSWCFILPTPNNLGTINTINDLVSLYRITSPTDINYKFYFMKFDIFFKQMLEDVKNKFHLISLIAKNDDQDTAVYFRYNPTNQYE